MTHEIWDIVRDVSGGSILLLLGVLLNRHLSRHDAEKKADADWRVKVDSELVRLRYNIDLGDEVETNPEGSGIDKHNDTHPRRRRRIREP